MTANNPRFKIVPIAFKVTGYSECAPDEAEWWAVYHYQENVPRYGSGWFPAYVKLGPSIADMHNKAPTKQGAQALLNLYCNKHGITLSEGEMEELA